MANSSTFHKCHVCFSVSIASKACTCTTSKFLIFNKLLSWNLLGILCPLQLRPSMPWQYAGKGWHQPKPPRTRRHFGPENRKMQQGLRSPGVLVSGHQDICHGQDQCIVVVHPVEGKSLFHGMGVWIPMTIPIRGVSDISNFWPWQAGKILKNFEWARQWPPTWYDAVLSSPVQS